MPAPFDRTLRSLQADSARRFGVQAAVAFALLAAWIVWFLFARVAVWAPAERARLEVANEVHQVQAPASGRVVEVALSLGRQVKAGDLLVRLDSEPERLRLDEEKQKGAAAQAQLDKQRAESAAEGRADAERRAAAKASIAEAQARAREAAELHRSAEAELVRLQPLRKGGLVSAAELSKTESLTVQQRAGAEAAGERARRLELEEQMEQSRAQGRLAALGREEARLSGLVEASRTAAASLAAEIDRRAIRAQIAGQLGRATPLQIGAVVKEGDPIAAIVPTGELRVVADFAPPVALGRVRPGQRARLRLHGFSWTQYGALPAVVTGVSREASPGVLAAQQGQIRVELSVPPGHGSNVPLQHGLPGDLEVEIEEVSPATLALRAAGALAGTAK